MTDAFREAAELEAGQRISAGGLPLRTLEPHPDTARADEAERMLALVMAKVNTFSPSQNPGACLMRDVPGLRIWCAQTGDRLAKIADLTARRDRERAALAATEAELAALTEGKPSFNHDIEESVK